MDIDIKSSEGKFKLRACGIVLKDGKILVDKAKNFDGYVYMGGHISIGESSRDAVIREAKEELQVDVEIERLICINENLYPTHDSMAQEVSFYYLLKSKQPLPDGDFERQEVDGGELKIHKYKWLDLNDAKVANLRPNWIIDMILCGAENYYYLSDQRENNE